MFSDPVKPPTPPIPKPPRIPLRRRRLAFLDLETTGFDPDRHEILEVAIAYDDDSRPAFVSKVRPGRLHTAQEDALRINGYRERAHEWKSAPTWGEVQERVVEGLDGCIVVGHNPFFDVSFLKTHVTVPDWRPPVRLVDTTTLAVEHLVPLGLDSLKLTAICAFLGIPNTGAHTAAADVRRTREVYRRLTRATRWDRLRWWLRAQTQP